MNTVPAIKLDTSLIPLVHDYLDAVPIEDLAFKYNLSEAQVSEFLDRREVRNYIKNTLINTGYVNKKSRIDLLSRIIEEKIKFSEENNVPLSKKDLVDVLKLLKDEEELISKDSDISADGQNIYVNILNELKAD